MRTSRFDALIAAVITAWSLAEVVAEDLQRPWLAAVLLGVAGVSLYWRRAYPLLVVVVIVASRIAQAAARTSLPTPRAPGCGPLVASSSGRAHEETARAVLGLTLLVCGVWIATGIDVWRGTDHYSGTDIPWIGALVATPGVLGIAFGARTRSLHRAEARAAELELERREAIVAERARI